MINRSSPTSRRRPSLLARLFPCCGVQAEPAPRVEPSPRTPAAPLGPESWEGFVRAPSSGVGRGRSPRPAPAALRFDPNDRESWAVLCVDPSHLRTEVHGHVDVVPSIPDAELPLELIADEGEALFPTEAGREAIAEAQGPGAGRAPAAGEDDKPPADHLRALFARLEAGGPFNPLRAEDAPAFARLQKSRLQNIWLVLGRNDATPEARLSILAPLSLLDEQCAQAIEQYLSGLYRVACGSDEAVRSWVEASTLENAVLASLATLRTSVLEALAGRLEATPAPERPYRAHTRSAVIGRFGPTFGLPPSVVQDARGDHNWRERRFVEPSFEARLPELFHERYDRAAIMGAVHRLFNESPHRGEIRDKLYRWIDENRPPGLETADPYNVKSWLFDPAFENVDDHAIAFVLWTLGVLRAPSPGESVGRGTRGGSVHLPSAGERAGP